MEAAMNQYNVLPINYINTLLGMSNDTKLRIIRLLTDSLINSEMVETGVDNTQQMLQKHAGAWVGNETAEELMSCIRENSSSRSPLEF